jgi:hypothetical protein
MGVQFIALALLVPIVSWTGMELTPHWALDFATHMVTCSQHGDEPYAYHVPPEIEKPKAASFLDAVIVAVLLPPPLIAVLPLDHLPRDRPPPLFSSLSHSLRAPPTLIPA